MQCGVTWLWENKYRKGQAGQKGQIELEVDRRIVSIGKTT